MKVPVFDGSCDIVTFIEQTTYGIWNEPDRDPGLIRRFYTPETVIHADGGDLHGDEEVLANTLERLRAFPDFHGEIDDTIWTADPDGGFRTSMRWTWSATNDGESLYGSASGRRVTQSAIANCHVRGWKYVEEWLAANQLVLTRQLGLDDDTAVACWRRTGRAPGSPARPGASPPCAPARPLNEAARAIFTSCDLGVLDRLYDPDAPIMIGAGRQLHGAAGARDLAKWWLSLVPGLTCRIDDQYACEDGGVARVATQWTLTSSSRFSITGVSHHHLLGDRVIAAWHEFDGLQVLRQLSQQAGEDPATARPSDAMVSPATRDAP